MDFSFRADSSDAARASTWLDETGAAHGMPAEPLWRLDLCLTEAVANVIAHGGPGTGQTPIRLRLDVRCDAGGGEATVIVSDGGAAFDPLAVPPKPPARSLAEAEPGGQGLNMMRKFSDALDYAYSDGRNHLTIRVRWNENGDRAGASR